MERDLSLYTIGFFFFSPRSREMYLVTWRDALDECQSTSGVSYQRTRIKPTRYEKPRVL